ncbi:MAG: helix-turn-helix domain-containing protein [Candidatus Competibacteraceae bacterium]|jgi:Ner family transcriptional regulator|nr:helix-turn-helix domain-containing protein [Candidatus Competibacteraceae bacterium]
MTTKATHKKKKARAIWIKHRLERKGTSYAQIAREEGVSRQAVNKAVYTPYPKMESAIARRLGLTVRQIWPERHRS